MLPEQFSIFEVVMLLCFSISWPVSIIKTLRTKYVLGKSPLFMLLVMLGYVFGILHKIFYLNDVVIYLYIINFIIIGVDVALYFYYAPINRRNQKQITV